MSDAKSPDLRQRIAGFTYRTLRWGRDHVPPGIRSMLGVLFMIGGVFGFLPILGFWMLPLGAAFIALDFPVTSHRIEDWMEHLKHTAKVQEQGQEQGKGQGQPSGERHQAD